MREKSDLQIYYPPFLMFNLNFKSEKKSLITMLQRELPFEFFYSLPFPLQTRRKTTQS
jgi:hypothetical protein